MTLATTLELIIEISLLVIVLAAFAIVASIVIVRNLQTTYKDLYRSQSKFDIELRKAANLVSKAVKLEQFAKFEDKVVKELPYEAKKELLDLIDDAFAQLDQEDPKLQYVFETYENLQESRRTLDAKILLFNQKIAYFPFNMYARFMKIAKQKYFTHK
jgi:hypothetical protein